MRTITAPLYIRPARVVEGPVRLELTGDGKLIQRRNILAPEHKRFKVLLAYLLEVDLEDPAPFRRLVEVVGYEPFLELAPPGGLTRLLLLDYPEEIPRGVVDNLHQEVRPLLQAFRPRLEALYGRLRKGARRETVEGLILECLEQAAEYGFTHHFTKDRRGTLVHIVEGGDIRAGALIGLALHLETRGGFPQFPEKKLCLRCGSPINPLLYRGRRYCSDACRRKAAKGERDRLVNLIQKKSARMVERGQLSEEKRGALLEEIKRERESLERIGEIARRYGVDPRPGKPGRPAGKGPKATQTDPNDTPKKGPPGRIGQREEPNRRPGASRSTGKDNTRR